MGLIRAGLNAVSGVLADQWKEFFYCESLSKDVLMAKGQKRVTGRSQNNGTDNIISNGSGIAVADGQCMIIVEQGKVVEVCAEPGQFTYDKSSEPSIFAGKLGDSIVETFKAIGRRFSYGADTGKDQRVYYFNTKELIDNKFGTPNPIPFRVVDHNIGLDIDVSIRCSGVYSYRIADPLLFYTNVCGNVSSEYRRSEIDTQLKTEFISALQPAFAKISSLEVRPSDIPAHAEDLSDAMNEALTKKWAELRGLKVVAVAMNTITLPEEDANLIKQLQRNAVMRDPTMAAATIVGSQSEAMTTAAGNKSGAITGFMGLGMAQGAGGTNVGSLYTMGAQQQQEKEEAKKKAQEEANSWKCAKCGKLNTGKFCSECGEKRQDSDEWVCAKCDNINHGKFCSECGEARPKQIKKCNKCGYEFPAGEKLPKFCPECGDPVNADDAE